MTTTKRKSVSAGIAGLLLLSLSSYGQVQNNGNLYIGSGANFYVPGNYAFGTSGATTATAKTASNGRLYLGVLGTTSGASASHFANGYVAYGGTTAFWFPVGDAGVYAPARVTTGVSAMTEVAYFRTTPANNTSVGAAVAGVSPTEYWDIKGTANNAIIRLPWRSNSNLGTLTANSLSSLTLVAYNTVSGQWEILNSTIDTTTDAGTASTLTAGSITASNVNLNTYRNFTFGRKQEDCTTAVVSSGITKTWNGSWSPSAPSIIDPVVIAAPYAGGSFSCYSLALNSTVTLSGSEYVEIADAMTGTGSILMSSESSIIQRNSAAAGPNIELSKTTMPKRRYDVVYWGSPVAGNVFSQIATAQAAGAALADAFAEKYKYVSGAGGGWQPLTATENGRGFATYVKPQVPLIDEATTAAITMKFSGTANNGPLDIPVVNNPGTPNGGTSYQFLANPYPSALDGQKFLIENAGTLSGTLYFWTAKTAANATTGAYTSADYAAWNLAGGVATSPTAILPTGKIASGQGFMVRALGTGNAKFTNCMRVSSGNNVFFRMSEPDHQERDRFKLTMTNAEGIFSQIQIGYFPEATNDFDNMYDAGRNSLSPSQLYSFVNDQKLAINTKSDFVITDEVALGVLKGADNQGVFTIALSDVEGTFANGTKVYLHDKQYNIYTDLTTSNYTFTTAATDNNRFAVVYENQALGNPDFNGQNAFAFIKAGQFQAQASSNIESVQLYDMTGRLVQQYKGGNSQSLNGAFNHSQGVYIAKIKLTTGEVVDAKLINM